MSATDESLIGLRHRVLRDLATPDGRLRVGLRAESTGCPRCGRQLRLRSVRIGYAHDLRPARPVAELVCPPCVLLRAVVLFRHV